MFDPTTIRRDFPIYTTQPDLAYLDSAATALKPQSVLDAMNDYYTTYSSNVGRGMYPLAEKATTAFETSRARVAQFLHLGPTDTAVFTANATHSINLVALGIAGRVTRESNIVVTALEHHSDYLPWKELALRTGAELRTAQFTEEGIIDTDHLVSLVDDKTVIVAFSAVSNVFGVINPVAEIAAAIRGKHPDAFILIDACQAAGHIPIDFPEWSVDFIVFSGHKLFGPTGIGVLTGKRASLETLVSMNVGGGTVIDACSQATEYKPVPDRLEGGTPNIAGAIGLAAAIEYVETIGLDAIHTHETTLVRYALDRLSGTFGEKLRVLGTHDSDQRVGIISFTLEGVHPHDVAHLLGEDGICVRAGEQCASPLHRSLAVPATTRLSLSIYNTEADIDRLVESLTRIRSLFTA